MNESEGRPAGMPTFGWTEEGRVVRLTERASTRKLLKLVTREGWTRWYPATDQEIRIYLASRAARSVHHEDQDFDAFET